MWTHVEKGVKSERNKRGKLKAGSSKENRKHRVHENDYMKLVVKNTGFKYNPSCVKCK